MTPGSNGRGKGYVSTLARQHGASHRGVTEARAVRAALAPGGGAQGVRGLGAPACCRSLSAAFSAVVMGDGWCSSAPAG